MVFSIVTGPNMKLKEDLLCDVLIINYLVEKAIEQYKNHPSIQMIQETFNSNKTISFELVSSGNILKKIASLDTKKASRSKDVPTKIVKANANLLSIFVSNAFNESAILANFHLF